MTTQRPLIRPFTALRPRTEHAAAVAAPPYDVLSSDEARVRAAGKPHSFLHISKAEIDLPPDVDHYSPAVYAKSAENLAKLIADGILIRDAKPCYYAYRLIMGEHTQTGLIAAASVADYDSNRIRKHEFTRPDKEDDRVRQIEALNAQTGPVLLAHPDSDEAEKLIADATAGTPIASVKAMLSESGVTLPVVRLMPNTPVAVGRGLILMAKDETVSDADVQALCAALAPGGTAYTKRASTALLAQPSAMADTVATVGYGRKLSISAAQGAWLNVLINIGGFQDQAFADEYRQKGQALLDNLAGAGETR